MVVSGGTYIYGIRLNARRIQKLLIDGTIAWSCPEVTTGQNLVDARCKAVQDILDNDDFDAAYDLDPDGLEIEPERSPFSVYDYNNPSPQLKLIKEIYDDLITNNGFDLVCTPHECRETDIGGNALFIGQSFEMYFQYGKLRIPCFDKKEAIDKIAADLGCEASYVFAPNDCNCCS